MSGFQYWYPILYEPPSSEWVDYIAPITNARTVRAAPRGWRQVRCYDRHAYRLMPLWLAWAYDFSVYWRWYVFGPLIRLGVLVGPEGGYFSDFRWWFWNAEREASWRDAMRIGAE